MSDKRNLLESIDARTRLAGSNMMEILLFSLGTRETFGINVFKVREVGRSPHITRTPNMPKGVEGLISLRGNVIPVLSLSSYLDLEGSAPPGLGKTMMVAEYSKRTLGFLVHEVDRIIRVDWERVKAPETVLASNQGLITAVIELEGGHLVSILDVEQILANAFGEPSSSMLLRRACQRKLVCSLSMIPWSPGARSPRCWTSWGSSTSMPPTAQKPGRACSRLRPILHRWARRYATRFASSSSMPKCRRWTVTC